ncbi:hypothetical protein [Pseudarthrobacter oxydans]|uniref:hypothetical protein n=1 Tax=Pseudarthrobacter oxydans TaxID=1671 RepID=UPI00342AC3D1
MAERYFVAAVPGGFSPVYNHATGGLVPTGLFGLRETAQAEADRLNREYEARQALARCSVVRFRQHAMPQVRRSVRWFPDDEFA